MDAVSDIKERLSIEDVVSEYVQLKRAGRNFKGLSPFGNEKTPSFMVSPEKQIWHDFSSGKGGNIFSFIMEVEGLDFKGALELLARKAGVDLSAYKQTAKGRSVQNKDRLYAVLDAAAHFYQVQLTKNTEALTYVRNKRGFSKETIVDFRLGYSPAGGKELMQYLLNKTFTVEEMKRVGLVTQRNSGVSDMFRDRIMVPLCDDVGRVVGFTARLLGSDDNAPKYINTPSTILYDKGRQAYGFDKAKDAIRKTGYVVIVEGNLDVIASHQAGIKQVVATAGTAMTQQHLKTMKRFTEDIRLCFDQDKAGQNAAERAIGLAQAVGVSLHMVVLPTGKDPDELVRQDATLWQQAIDQPVYVVDWLIERYRQQLDITTATGKRQLSDVVLALVRQLKDSVEQDHYVQKLSQLLGVDARAMRTKLGSSAVAPQERRKQVKATAEQSDAYIKEQTVREQHLLAIALQRKFARKLLPTLPVDIFVTDQAQTLKEFLLAHPEVTRITVKDYAIELQNITDYVKMMTLLYEELYQQTEPEELAYQTQQLVARMVHEYVKNKKKAYIQAMSADVSQVEMGTILQNVKDLDDMAKKYSDYINA